MTVINCLLQKEFVVDAQRNTDRFCFAFFGGLDWWAGGMEEKVQPNNAK